MLITAYNYVPKSKYIYKTKQKPTKRCTARKKSVFLDTLYTLVSLWLTGRCRGVILAAGTYINDGCRFGESGRGIYWGSRSWKCGYKVVRASLGCISSKGLRTSFATDKIWVTSICVLQLKQSVFFPKEIKPSSLDFHQKQASKTSYNATCWVFFLFQSLLVCLQDSRDNIE